MVIFEKFIDGWDIAKAELVKAWLVQHIGPQLPKAKDYENLGEGWRLVATPPKIDKLDNKITSIHIPSWTLYINNDALALQFKLTWL
jgi:hypothetical protein